MYKPCVRHARRPKRNAWLGPISCLKRHCLFDQLVAVAGVASRRVEDEQTQLQQRQYAAQKVGNLKKQNKQTPS